MKSKDTLASLTQVNVHVSSSRLNKIHYSQKPKIDTTIFTGRKTKTKTKKTQKDTSYSGGYVKKKKKQNNDPIYFG